MTHQRHKRPQPKGYRRGSEITPSEPRFLAIGQITKPHGVYGEVSVAVLTDFVERFETMKAVLVGDQYEVELLEVASTRWHNERVLIRFSAYPDRNAVENLRGLYLQIPIEEAMVLDEGEYYTHELIGLAVITDQDEPLGKIAEVLETGANDVYLVRNDQGELLLPAISDVILSVDLAEACMVVHLLPGLEPDWLTRQ